MFSRPGSTTASMAARLLAALLTVCLTLPGAALAQQQGPKPVKPGEIRSYDYETLPAKPPASQSAQPSVQPGGQSAGQASPKAANGQGVQAPQNGQAAKSGQASTNGQTVEPAPAKPTEIQGLTPVSPKPSDKSKAAAPSGQGGTKAEGDSDPALAERPMSTTVKQPADFNECVRVALVQSPMLVKSALEIETKRLDVQDAWSSFVPTISINTTYWFRMPTKLDGTQDKPYTISFSSGQWNPVLSGFEVKARQEMTSIAILGHLKVISEGLKRLATDFLQLAAIAEQKELNRKKQDLAKMNLDFYKTRLSLGQATQLDIRIAETRIQMAKAEEEKINTLRSMIVDDIKFIMGVPFTNKLELDVASAKKQILGAFGPADISDEKIRAHSFDLRMQVYEKSLQRKNIGLSYVKLLPSFGFTFQTVDAFNNASSRTTKDEGFPFYPGINISMPLDYWTKGREIARQYKKLDQLNATSRAKEFEVMVSVQKALSEYQSANADLLLSSSKTELTRLQDEQTEYRHKTGQVEFDKFVTDRNDFFDSKSRMLLEQAKRDVALLNLKHLSGDLQNQYIDVTTWEN